ncbi:hypothetical protein ABIE58_001838 [Roseovarius sp. MBR-78]|jgi:hypothetical protein|uniref:hypothetical protein n=1 Tax=Roseovarius sp. MBR-78 TaxID=3156460 RepID=UPI0033974518
MLPYDRYETVVKTLQARIAEDIIRNRTKSRFIRTSIGTYFLRDLLERSTIFGAIKLRRPRAARVKPEHPYRVLYLPEEIAKSHRKPRKWENAEAALLSGQYFYQLEAPDSFVPVVTSVALSWRDQTFVYTVGSHTHFTQVAGQRSFHIRKFLDEFDLDLFETDGTGATSSSARTLLPVLVDGRRSRLEGGKLDKPEQLQFFQVSGLLDAKRAYYSHEIKCFILSSNADVSIMYSCLPETVRRMEHNATDWVPTKLLPKVITDPESLYILNPSARDMSVT